MNSPNHHYNDFGICIACGVHQDGTSNLPGCAGSWRAAGDDGADYQAEIQRLSEENARLREALEGLVKQPNWSEAHANARAALRRDRGTDE